MGREEVKWDLRLCLFWTGKMESTSLGLGYLITGNEIGILKMEMGFLFFRGL